MIYRPIYLLVSSLCAMLLLTVPNVHPQSASNDQSFVKPHGWNIAPLEQLKTKSHSQLRVASGNVNVTALLVPEEGILFDDTAYYLNVNGNRTLHPLPMNAYGAARFDVNGRVFCYTIFGSGVAIEQISKSARRVAALGCEFHFAFYDEDGDGKFETLVPLPDRTAFEPHVPLWAR